MQTNDIISATGTASHIPLHPHINGNFSGQYGIKILFHYPTLPKKIQLLLAVQ